jgi:hypothetical protein
MGQFLDGLPERIDAMAPRWRADGILDVLDSIHGAMGSTPALLRDESQVGDQSTAIRRRLVATRSRNKPTVH